MRGQLLKLVLGLFLILTVFLPQNLLAQNEIFKVVEEMPRFPGCEYDHLDKDERKKCANDAMMKYIYSNLKLFGSSCSVSEKDKVYIRFIVRKDGSLTDFSVKRSVSEPCDKLALEAVKSMTLMKERWIPGNQRGNLTNVFVSVPIELKRRH